MIRYRVSGFGFRNATAGLLLAALWVITAGSANAQPDKGYHAISYSAVVTLDRLQDSLSGEVTMNGFAPSPITEVTQHAKYLTIDSVFLNGKPATVMWADTATGEYYVIPNDEPTFGSSFTVKTFYHGPGKQEQYAQHWGGVDDEDTMMFAMGVGFQAPYTGCTRHWLPCYDLPDDKPDSVDLTFVCRDGDITTSNGLLVSTSSSAGWRTMHWHESHPIATYLLTFATGPFTEQSVANPLNIPFEVYALRRDSVEASIQMNVRVRQILEFYDSLFASYPFEKVGYVVTPIGSMEHQTMICLDKHILTGDSAHTAADTSTAGTVAVHELAHMWWGDRVTCMTFDDAWLNEGFATYCESLVLERLFGRGKYLSRQHVNIAGAKTSTLPLFGAATLDKHSNNYPYSTIYQKGAAVLGMLRQYLGDSVFFECIRKYGDAHAYSTASSLDLWKDFEKTSGQDLGWFFKEWVFGTGYPKDTIMWSRKATGVSITFHQNLNNAVTPYFRMPIPVRGSTKTGQSKVVTVWMDSIYSSEAFADFGFAPDTIVFDPDGLLIMKIAKQSLSVNTSDPNSEDQFLRRIYPNPDRDRPLVFEVPMTGTLTHCSLVVYDMRGQVVRDAVCHPVGLNLHGEISTSGLAAGTYRIRVTGDAGYFPTYPFVVEH